MKKIIISDWVFILILFGFSVFYFWGVNFIPFHPDETTQIYMSDDFNLLFTNPGAMIWSIESKDDPKQQYRLLDAPLTRNYLGFIFLITGNQALRVDWNWSESWEENIRSGAYPDIQLIQTARISITALLPLSLIFLYLIGKAIGGKINGLLAVLLMGSNPVVLLHGRRAMAEGFLLFGVVFATWTLLKARDHAWLAGIGLAIALNAKQSALALVPVFFLALMWLSSGIRHRVKKRIYNIIFFILILLVVTLILNPVSWRNPIQVAQESVRARGDLLSRQVEDIKNIAPNKYLDKPFERVFILILNLFISPPDYGLIGNLLPTQQSLNEYIDLPGHNLFRGIIWGGIFFVVTSFGVCMAIRKVFRSEYPRQKTITILLLATFFMASGLIYAVPLPWVRYSIPMIPFSSLWLAYGLSYLFTKGPIQTNT